MRPNPRCACEDARRKNGTFMLEKHGVVAGFACAESIQEQFRKQAGQVGLATGGGVSLARPCTFHS